MSFRRVTLTAGDTIYRPVARKVKRRPWGSGGMYSSHISYTNTSKHYLLDHIEIVNVGKIYYLKKYIINLQFFGFFMNYLA